MKEFRGDLKGDGIKFGIVVGRFNETITDRLLAGALDILRRSGVAEDDLYVVHVPGSFEIPLAAERLAAKVDAVVCLGAVIRGETLHFDLIASHVARGIGAAGARSGKPVTFGVLTTDNVEQAMNRAGLKFGNKGMEAALAALEMANLMRSIDEQPS